MRLTRLTVQVLLHLTFSAAPLSVEAQPLQQVDIGFAVLLALVVPIGLILGAWAGYVIGRWYGVVRGLHGAWVGTLVGGWVLVVLAIWVVAPYMFVAWLFLGSGALGYIGGVIMMWVIRLVAPPRA
jgi:hypothetical protein